MFISGIDGAEMPMWCPPTPPQDDNDIYMDETLSFLYEPRVMPEQTLPPVYVPKAHKKPKIEAITTRKQKQRKEEQPRVPRSLFDKPKEVVMKQKRDAKMQRLRQNLQVPSKILTGRSPIGQQQQQQPQPPPVPAVKQELEPNYPEWLPHEEWALIEAVQNIQKLTPETLYDNPAHTFNWDFVSDFVSSFGRIFRAPRYCRQHYESVILAREDGKGLYNPKQKKASKSMYKEGLKNFSQLFDIRFAAIAEIASKRPSAMRQTIVNPAAKPPKNATIFAEYGINYDNPLLPSQIAAKRAERLAQEKKKQQTAAAQQQAQATAATVSAQDATAVAQRPVQAAIVATGVTPAIQGQTSIVSVTPIPGQVNKVAVGQGLTAVSIARTLGTAAGNIIVNTSLQSGPFAAINKRMSQASTQAIAVTGSLTPTIRGQRPPVAGTPTITMQDLGVTPGTSTTVTVAAQVAAAAARSALPTSVTSNLAAGQKLAALTATGTATLQPHLVQAARNFTPQQINILRQPNQSIIRTQAATGTQQIRGQKLMTADQIRAQQLKQTKVITQQLLVPIRGTSILSKQALLRSAIPKMTDEQLQALRMRTQMQQAQQGKPLQTAQIIQGQVTTVGQVSAAQTPVTLVKSVTAAPTVSVPVTIPVTAISVGQQRAVVAATRATTVNQIQQQRMQLLQTRKTGAQQKVTGIATGKTGQQIPLLIPQHSKLLTSNQIFQQIGIVNKSPGLQQIIHNSQPTIITQVSQAGGQPIQQVVAKVSLQSGTPITVTHVNSPTVGLSLTGQGGVKTATITSLDTGTHTIPVHSIQQKTVSALTQQSLVPTQAIQVQQVTSAQVAPFLQMTQTTVQTQPSTIQQQATVTVPANLVTATSLRASATPMPATSRSQTPTQISLVATPTPPPVATTLPGVQVQPSTPTADVSTPQVIAQNVPSAAAMATVVTQTSQPDTSTQASGQKTPHYTMRTRNAKH